jgi:hypothetical protein
MRIAAVTAALVLVVVGTAGCAVPVAGVAVPQRDFGDEQGRFGLAPPSGWVLDTSGSSGTAAVFLNPQPTESAAGRFTANINVLVLPAATGLPGTVTDARQEVTTVRGYRGFEDEPFTLADGTPGHLLGGRFDGPSGFVLRNVQLFTVHEDRTIVVTGTAPADAWDVYGSVFASTLRTVTVRS